MRFVCLFLLFVCWSYTTTQAQNWAGTWKGQLDINGTLIPLVFHLQQDGQNQWSATMDSPEQMAYDIAFDAVEPSGQTIELRIKAANVLYEGQMQADGETIKGTWTQGTTYDLDLTRTKDTRSKRPQHPKGPFPYDVETVYFSNKKAGIELQGTLTLPANRQHCPAVVLISGSGPQDRDQTIMRHKPFWVLADYLTRRGVVVLRYDERGVGKSGGTYQGATSADLSTDVAAAFDYLRKHPRVNGRKVGLIGHSEGGLIAPMVASQQSKVAFLVLMAGPGVSGAEVLLRQNNDLMLANGLNDTLAAIRDTVLRALYAQVFADTNQTQTADQYLAALAPTLQRLTPEQRQAMELTSRTLRQTISALRSPWLGYFVRSQPRDYLTQVQCPVLALNGGKDVQVHPDNLFHIAQALSQGGNTHFQINAFPELNHLFQTAETGVPKEYESIEETLSPVFLATLEGWLVQIGVVEKSANK